MSVYQASERNTAWLGSLEELSSPLTEKLRHQRAEIDESIGMLLDELCSLRALRNTKTLINSKLPPEILSKIFSFVKFLHQPKRKPSFFDPEKNRKMFGWIKCTSHVCEYWRSIALSNPSLWVDGLPSGIDAIKAFLERSKELPIALESYAVGKMWSSPEIHSIIFPHIRRVRELSVSTDLSIVSKVVNLLNIDMPHLEALDLHASPYGANEDVSLCVEIPNTTILQHVRILKLVSFGFCWSQVGLRNLTVLQLSGHLHPHLRPAVCQILDALKLSPGLQELHLRYVVHDDARIPNVIVEGLYLPELVDLVLDTDGATLATIIINPLVLPKVEKIHLSISTNDESTIASLLLSFSRALKRRLLTNIDVFDYFNQENRKLLFMAYGFSYSNDVVFSNTWDGDNNQDVDIAGMVLSCLEELDLNSLIEFKCLFDQSIPEQWWRRMFHRAVNLENLRTEGLKNPGGLISALTPKLIAVTTSSFEADVLDTRGEDEENGTMYIDNRLRSVLLPFLFTLTFAAASFTPSISQGWAMDSTPYEDGSLDHLARCLKERRDYGAIQHTLQLLQISNDVRESSHHLRQFVHHLEFEGQIVFDWD